MAAREGQLDEISQAIGRLSGQVDSLDRYTHEREHSINNLVQKVEALGTRITRDIAAVEGRIEGRIKAMDDRNVALGQAKQTEAGAKNLVVWLLQRHKREPKSLRSRATVPE
jgi:septal ring factor EnvC (AmiA/AmiB activator)